MLSRRRKQGEQHEHRERCQPPRVVRLGDLYEVADPDADIASGSVSSDCFYEITDPQPQVLFGRTTYRANLMHLRADGGVECYLTDALVFDDMLGAKIEEAQQYGR